MTDVSIVEKFRRILDRADENHVQSYLEQHTELIPVTGQLNHHLHLNAIISKLPISTSLTTDFVYLTKSTVRWRMVLVEIESPRKKLFTQARKPTFTSDFNQAYDQVLSWKGYLDEHQREVKELVSTLLCPLGMASNPMEFKYLLVIGRRSDYEGNEDRKILFSQKSTSDFWVWTYDSLESEYTTGSSTKHVILAKERTGFNIKNLDSTRTALFAYLHPQDLRVTQSQKESLARDGFDMKSWCSGALLTLNNRQVLRVP